MLKVICYFNTGIKENFRGGKMVKIGCPKAVQKRNVMVRSGNVQKSRLFWLRRKSLKYFS